jgi:RNA polymerase sigma-70 factor (ECF subfamily)
MSSAAEPVRRGGIDGDLERHRTALTRHCSRMLGSRSEAEDAVQETLLRAWRSHARFERRCATRTWLRQIATNVCIDMLHGRSRRAVPVDPASLASAWLEAGAETDPAAQMLARENFRLAWLTAIERLPPRQRAVLLLREGLSWQASEVAELLGTSSAAVNSALQRARRSLKSCGGAGDRSSPVAAHSRSGSVGP